MLPRSPGFGSRPPVARRGFLPPCRAAAAAGAAALLIQNVILLEPHLATGQDRAGMPFCL